MAVIGLAGVVGRHRQRCLANRQGPIGIANGVVPTGQSTRGDHIAACVHRALAGAAVAQRATQHAAALVVHQPRVTHAICARVGLAVIGLAGVVGRHRQRPGRDAAHHTTDRVRKNVVAQIGAYIGSVFRVAEAHRHRLASTGIRIVIGACGFCDCGTFARGPTGEQEVPCRQSRCSRAIVNLVHRSLQGPHNRSETRRADDQGSVAISNGVVGACVTRGHYGVAGAHVGGALRCAAIGQAAAQGGFGFIVDEAAVDHTIAPAVSVAVIDLAVIVGRDGERHRSDHPVAARKSVACQRRHAVGQHVIARIGTRQRDVGDGVGHQIARVLGGIGTRAAGAHRIARHRTAHGQHEAVHGGRTVISFTHAAGHRSRHRFGVDLQRASDGDGVAVVDASIGDSGSTQLISTHIELT